MIGHSLPIVAFGFFAAAWLAAAPAVAQAALVNNAPREHAGTCDYGYVVRNGACEAVAVPEFGYLNGRGDDWLCVRTHRRIGDRCAPVTVPANGYLVQYGERGWMCERGFRAREGQCVPVDVPANGFLSDRGDAWQCERGFMRGAAACVPVAAPEGAHIDQSGAGWECNRPLRRSGDRCIAPVPQAAEGTR